MQTPLPILEIFLACLTTLGPLEDDLQSHLRRSGSLLPE